MNNTIKQRWTYGTILIILFVTFIIFQPKISVFIFPQKRAFLWKSFYEKTVKTKQLNLRDFWMLREFYYPGYFIFNPYRLSDSETNTMLKKIGISVNQNAFFYPFLSYHSGKIQSLETLVTQNKLAKILIFPKTVPNPILNDKSTLVFYPEKNKVMIVFIRPLDEMKKTNGFFNYRGIHKKIVEKKIWFSASLIDLR